jgi:hypothetical protein
MLQSVERETTSIISDLDNNDSKKLTASINVFELNNPRVYF